MNSESLVELAAERATRTFAFTLATALSWLGHDCPGGCPQPAAELPASVWFVRRPADEQAMWTTTLVVVDLGDCRWPHARVHSLLRGVNRCARRDHIRVREKAKNDRGRALAIVTAPAPRGPILYVRPDKSRPDL